MDTQSEELNLADEFFDVPADETPADEPAEELADGAAEDNDTAVDQGKEDEAAAKDEAKPEDGADDEAEEVFTVKVDGEEIEVGLDELLNGYQRDKDYRQKTQTLAEERRAYETERSGELEQLKNALTYYALPTNDEPRPENFPGQPEEFMQAYGKWQKEAERQSEAQELLEAITAEETTRRAQYEGALLMDKVPEWQDQEVFASEFKAMSETAVNRYGFTEEELASVNDHRLYLLLRDASRAAELSAKPVVLQRKTQVKPKLNAGAKTKTDPNVAKQKSALDKLNKTGRIADGDASSLFFNEA